MADSENAHNEQEATSGNGNPTGNVRIAAIAIAVAVVVLAAGIGIGFAIHGSQQPEPIAAQEQQQPADNQNASDNSQASQDVHKHDWVAEYETVHHDAETHVVHHDAVYENQTVFPQVPHHTLRCADGPAYRLRKAVLCDDCSPITVFGDQRQHRPLAGRKAGLRPSTAHRLFRFLALPVDRSGQRGSGRLACQRSRAPRPCPRRGCRISPTPTLLPPGPPALRQLAAFSLSPGAYRHRSSSEPSCCSSISFSSFFSQR